MRLPEVQLRPGRGARPSAAVAQPSDLGLGEVARGMEEWAGEVERTRLLEEEVARAEAEEAVRPILSRFETEADAEFNEAGAAWDGVEPGFARRATARLAERRTGFGDDLPLTSTERDALERGLNRYGEGLGQRAIQYESQRRGAFAVEAAAAREGATLARISGAYMRQLGEKQAEIDARFDGSTDDYEASLLAEHDLIANQIVAEAPEHLRPRVQQQMQQQRLQLQARAMDVQQRGTQAYVAGQVRAGGDATLNALIGSPSMYEQAVANVDQLVAPLPAAARGGERARLLDGYTDVYVSSMIDAGEPERAIALLEGGALDGRLRPDTKARLMTAAIRKRDEPDPADIVAQVQADAAMRDNLASIAATGMPIAGADPASLAEVLTPAQLARYAAEVEEARRQHAALPGFDGMSAAEISAHVEGLRPEPGQPGYAEAEAFHSRAAQIAQQTLTRRAEDPAGAALAASPVLATQLEGLQSGDREARRRAAAAYVAGQDALQEDWGVPAHQRRVLAKPAAAAIVAAFEGDEDPANGLRTLAGVLDAFTPPAGAGAEQQRAAFAARTRVIAELKAAGADAGDIAAAVDLSADPVRLGRYVAATRGGALERLDGADRRKLNEAVEAELAPWLASFAAAPGSRDLVEGRRLMAQRLAAERLAAGGSERDAARAGVDVLEGGYVFVGQQGWRMPRQMAESRIDNVPGERIARQGTARMMAFLSQNAGQGFYTPADNGRGMSDEQRRRRYADTVRSQGRWVATADDRGLVLMTPNLDGGWTAALSSEGRPIAYSWQQLMAAGRQRGPDGRVALGGGRNQTNLPRGVRNNNPGNIEFRRENPWQGQTGSDGRFARFATPEAGIRALSIDLGVKARRGLDSVQEVISAWAPPSENNTRAYVARVVEGMSRTLGRPVTATERLDMNDPRVRGALVGAIIHHENGYQPYDNALIGRVVRGTIRR